MFFFNSKLIGVNNTLHTKKMLLESVTVFVKETFHDIDGDIFPEAEYQIGRILNPPEGGDPQFSDGHKIVAVNQIIEDDDGNSFRVIDVLGSGTFSYVFKCQLLSDPRTFAAMKIIKCLPQYRATGIAEISMHQKLLNAPDHPGKPHVIMPLTSFEEEGHVIMVMPLLFRSLFEGIYQNRSISDLLGNVQNVMRQILLGIQFIHKNGVIHCDLKPENIMFASEDQESLQIIDLGSAITSGSGLGDYIQSRFYRSPEVMLGLPYNNKIDMWSCGCIAAEIYLDFAIFACNSEIDAIHSMVALLGPIPDELLGTSRSWWKFFDMTREGYKLKMDPNDVVTMKHLYASIFQQTGPLTLEQLIMSHKQPETEEDEMNLQCFSHFVHSLLVFNPNERLSATQALQHPFITGEELTEDWAPEPEPDLPQGPTESRGLPRSSSMDSITASSFFSPFVF